MSTALLPSSSSLSLLEARQGEAQAMQAAVKAAQAQRSAHNDKMMEKIDETAQDFEAVFISEMMKPMFEGLSTEAPFGGGKGEEVFRGMLLQEYGKLISQTGAIGLSDNIKAQMIQMQEEANAAALPAQEINTTPVTPTREGASTYEP